MGEVIERAEMERVFNGLFNNEVTGKTRRVQLYANAGGFDLFNEALEEQVGLKRVYLPDKLARIFVKNIKVKKSATGRNYKTIGKVKTQWEE